MTFSAPRGTAAYRQSVYMTKDRWVSYFWQTRLLQSSVPQGKILEVGVGNGLMGEYLRASGYQVDSVDIDASLKPTFVGSVADLGFLGAETYDAVLCAEVLEHLPFEQFLPSLRGLRRVTKKYVVLSLPYWGYTFGGRIRLPIFGQATCKFKLSGFKTHVFNGQHHWEIGKRGYPLRLIKKTVRESGFRIASHFWDLDDPYHYYFLLEKN
jgi:SAM-dependent methyltransferase